MPAKFILLPWEKSNSPKAYPAYLIIQIKVGVFLDTNKRISKAVQKKIKSGSATSSDINLLFRRINAAKKSLPFVNANNLAILPLLIVSIFVPSSLIFCPHQSSWLVILQLSTFVVSLFYLYQFRKQQLNNLQYGDALNFRAYHIEDRSLLPYITWLYLLFVASFTDLAINEQIFFPIKNERAKQFIDIELVSNNDFQNKQEILPSTTPKLSLGHRSSPINSTSQHNDTIASISPDAATRSVTSKSHQTVEPVGAQHARPLSESVRKDKGKGIKDPVDAVPFVIYQAPNRKQSELKQNYVRYSILANDQTTNRVLPLSAPLTLLPNKSFAKPKESTADLALEEVEPPQLTEIKDNDGDNSKELWQDGGHSAQGYGTPSSLTNYLQELHKKLKHTWSPPSGSIRHIKVLFRLTRDGDLASLQLTTSSGDNSADNSALAAISKAAPFGKLPKDFPGKFLDLVYTFNYTADELKEMN